MATSPGSAKSPGSARYAADWIAYWQAHAPQVLTLLDASVDLDPGPGVDAQQSGSYPIILPALGNNASGVQINRLNVLGLLNSIFYNAGHALLATADTQGRTVGVRGLSRADYAAAAGHPEMRPPGA